MPTDREASEALVRHPGIDKVAFTGSTAAGRRIAAFCGEQLKRASLELGGKSAAVLLGDVDLASQLPGIVSGGMSGTGQQCTALTRILVPRARHDEILDAVTETARNLVVGDPADPATFMGPLISEAQRERVEGYIALGQQEGATITTGGGRPAGFDRGYYIEPTVFAGARNDMRVAREEIFGPVVCVIPYDDDDAVRLANDSEYGLAASVFSPDTARARAIADQIRAGTVSINTAGIDPVFPFGGFKASGIGRELGTEGLDAYYETQTVVLPPAQQH